MFLQKFLNHHPHFCSGRVALLPVNRAILTESICQLFCNGNQLFVLIEILDCLRFCQCIIERQLIGCQPKLVTFLLSRCDLLCQIKELLNDFFICKHTVQITVHSALDDLAEFLRLDHIGATVNLHLLSYQLLQQFNREVFLLHLRDFLKELRIKQRELLRHIRKQIDDAFALHALTEECIYSRIHFRQRDFLSLALIHKAHNKHTD